jgi:glycine/D-amino acid oxidase-like deaminating enzyme
VKTGTDAIIVGGGIAGLMTAVRLASAGMSVEVYDRGLLGSQSTTSNHGMIHSGVFYSKWHPEIVPHCREAVDLFAARFPDAVLSTESYGYGRPETIDEMSDLWTSQGCAHRPVPAADVSSIFNPHTLDRYAFVASRDMSVSSRQVLVDLVRTGLDLGVRYHLHANVTGLAMEGGAVAGVTLAGGHVARAARVILSAGLGISAIAHAHGLKLKDRLVSRLDMMVAYPGEPLGHMVLCHDFGSPNIAPTLGNRILASPYGGVQPPVRDYRRWPVPMPKLIGLASDLRRIFHPDLIDFEGGVAHMCSKTEVRGTQTDQFGGQPGFAVINHGEEDGIDNLWTLLPGKMTLGFHASQALASKVLQTRVAHEIAPRPGITGLEADALVAVEPWHSLEEGTPVVAQLPGVLASTDITGNRT